MDVAGNTRYANETVATLVVSGGTNDSEVPVLVAVNGPATAQAGAAVTFTYRLTDASGVANANVSTVTSGGHWYPDVSWRS